MKYGNSKTETARKLFEKPKENIIQWCGYDIKVKRNKLFKSETKKNNLSKVKDRSIHPEVFYERGVPKNLSKLTENHYLFLIKLPILDLQFH